MNEELKFYVAGVQYHELSEVEDIIEEGDWLDLEPELDNKFDPNAVRLIYDKGYMLGYVPQKGEMSAKVKSMLEVSDLVYCEVIEFNKNAKPWQKLYVKVVVED